ncbi:hypothetical protein DKG79_08245 [Escherichia fergusonii]|nr:hypothetical protein DKG79_08245 [Escherichia fergusonii]
MRGAGFRNLSLGEVVIWDLIVLRNPALHAEWDNIEQIIEIKFHNDTLTDNQEIAKKQKWTIKSV